MDISPNRQTHHSGGAARPRQRSRATEFTDLIGLYIEREGRSLNRIAQAARIDVAYPWRLRVGEKCRPSRDVLIRLGLVLKLEPEELDELLVAADLAPITWRRI